MRRLADEIQYVRLRHQRIVEDSLSSDRPRLFAIAERLLFLRIRRGPEKERIKRSNSIPFSH
jgi:hypothetical protein